LRALGHELVVVNGSGERSLGVLDSLALEADGEPAMNPH
jgi:hypothetical protein